MAITRWKPFEDLMSAQNEVSRFFDEFFGKRFEGITPSSARRTEDGAIDWIPRVDISETDDEIIVKADAPGMEKDNVKITLSENVLTISGEKNAEHEEKKKNYHRVERVFGSFTRSFYIPTNVDSSKIKASYENGVLTVKLPKKEEAKPKEIPIEVE
ncbi:Hsp20/alpha crystallin family protein [bacterium]|nr:Hsp20/alpha crystallin family protein [bacterium]